jgi:hypothetical protein
VASQWRARRIIKVSYLDVDRGGSQQHVASLHHPRVERQVAGLVGQPLVDVPVRTVQVVRLDADLRVRVEIMGPVKYENVGKSQPVLMMINPMIFTHTRMWRPPAVPEAS